MSVFAVNVAQTMPSVYCPDLRIKLSDISATSYQPPIHPQSPRDAGKLNFRFFKMEDTSELTGHCLATITDWPLFGYEN